MNAPTAIQGTYADLKLIRGRKVAVICVEIPIERAEEFVRAFGMPDPAAEKWVALARLNGRAVEKPEKEKRRFEELPPAQQAALACQREAFQRFCQEVHGTPGDEISEEAAAGFVRHFCEIESRAELSSRPYAAGRWDRLYFDFQLWLNDPEAGRAA